MPQYIIAIFISSEQNNHLEIILHEKWWQIQFILCCNLCSKKLNIFYLYVINQNTLVLMLLSYCIFFVKRISIKKDIFLDFRKFLSLQVYFTTHFHVRHVMIVFMYSKIIIKFFTFVSHYYVMLLISDLLNYIFFLSKFLQIRPNP